jgi:PAS domain S-box-containing protein
MTEQPSESERQESVVLIVDDNPANLRVVATELERQGYRILVAEDGNEALERAGRVAPDLILLDVMMPGINGFEVCRRLKAQTATRTIPVIFMTVLTDMKDKLAAFEAGAVDYVIKPLQVEEVIARVGTQLELDAMRKRLEAQNVELAAHREKLEHLVAERTAELQEANQKLRGVIEERRKAQDELATRERIFRTLTENLPDNLIRYNRKCLAVYVNPQTARITACKPEELIGTAAFERLPDPEQVQRYRQALERVLRTAKPEKIEIELPQADGGTQIFQVSFVAEQRGNGEVRGALAISRDITLLKETERQLEESNTELKAMARRRETAREEERKHIARELHDDLGQYLTALQLHTSVLNIEFSEHNPTLGTKLEQLLSLVDSTKKVTRNLSQRLRPAEIDMGIEAALNELVDQFCAQYGINCNLELSEELDTITDSYSVIIYRVLQESLTNIARHAEANNVEVVLQCRNDGVMLMIRDDGKGFDPSTVEDTSFGLVGMRERVLAVGGDLKIYSELQKGTRVVANLPNVEDGKGVTK